MKRREALEAYRRSRAGTPPEKLAEPVVERRPAASAHVPTPNVVLPGADDLAHYAAKWYENWITTDNATDLVEYYAYLPLSTQRQKVLNWAVEKACEGNLHPLLSIGIDDLEPALRKHLNRRLENIPSELLLAKLTEERFSIRERRSVAGLLGRCKEPQAGKLLAKLADHEDARVRESALEALAHYPQTEGLQLPIFIRRLDSDPHPDVQVKAAEGLARIGSPQAVAALMKITKMEDARPELLAVLAGWQAKHRPKTEFETGEQAVVKIPKKPPTKELTMIVVIIVLFAFAGMRLSEPVKRWYNKKFPQPVQVAPAPGN